MDVRRAAAGALAALIGAAGLVAITSDADAIGPPLTVYIGRSNGTTEPFATGSAYVNFMPDDEADRAEKIYGANYRRLSAIKGRYDPGNLFRMNQNIKPVQ